MTEEERELYAKRAARRQAEEKDKPKMAFMQKYYHKGAFFQEAADDAFGTAGPDEIYKRDFPRPPPKKSLTNPSSPAPCKCARANSVAPVRPSGPTSPPRTPPRRD